MHTLLVEIPTGKKKEAGNFLHEHGVEVDSESPIPLPNIYYGCVFIYIIYTLYLLD